MIYTSLHIFLKFPGIKTSCRDFFHPGHSDPRSLSRGARGPLARPRWRNGQGSHARRLWSPAGSPTVTAGHEGGRGGVLRDRKLTRSPLVRSEWPEEGQRRWIGGGGPRFLRGKTATATATPVTRRRFLRWGASAWEGEASRHVGRG
jgi:hypothetical protein